jgi:predicted GNAT family N-acyltransferase
MSGCACGPRRVKPPWQKARRHKVAPSMLCARMPRCFTGLPAFMMSRACMNEMTFKEIAFGTDEYNCECLLREEVLRKPLGLSLCGEDLAGEENQLHFGLFEPMNNLVACVIAVALSPTEAKIRQMAVVPSHQGKGLGRSIMGELEKTLRARGFRTFVLDARASAVGFYQKVGYRILGDEFVEVTVPHCRMIKAV